MPALDWNVLYASCIYAPSSVFWVLTAKVIMLAMRSSVSDCPELILIATNFFCTTPQDSFHPLHVPHQLPTWDMMRG